MNNASGRVLVLVFLVISMAATGGAVFTGVSTATDGETAQRIAVQEERTDGEQNETTRHRNPNDYSENGDLESVEGWLSDRLTAQLSEGAVQLSEGQYELADEYVSEEYRERLGQYVDVAGQTEGESLEEEFEETGEQQSRLSEVVEEYRETKSEYEAAREAGNEERARELARELEALATEIESLGGSVRNSYAELEEGTGANLSEADAAVEAVTTEIEAEQADVREQEFEETTLRLTADRDTISFREPLLATGELRTADGAPIANQEIRLDIGNHTERVTTDATGGFSLEYRPTTESLSTDELEIQYVPDPQSTYLGDTSNVSVSIEQVEPTVSLDDVGSTVSYTDEAAITGELTVDDVSVDGVTLAVLLEGERVGTATVQNGVFGTTVTSPVSVENGEQELSVRLPFEEQALAAAAETTNVSVRETESNLSVDGTSTGDREISVNGTLATAGGDGVQGETVQLRIDGMTVGTVTTGAGGTFGDTISVPDSINGGDVTVAAVYDGTGSSLEPVTAETVVTVGEPGGQLSTVVWLAGGFIAVIAAGFGVWWYRRSAAASPPSGPADEQRPTPGEGTVTGHASDSSPDTVTPLLQQASEHLSNGHPDDAARTGYAAVRRALASRIDGQGALTHWEFYHMYRSNDAAETELLHDITEGYEHAAFGHSDVSSDEAAGILEKARRLCGVDEPVDGTAPADD
ncbi:hypothetical protein [Natrinema sp. H-ect4]|uniref:hypothetical protein n=1 Tax=Natrinema sp. H-ect4 TaxID=3242699 RepID=UPI0035A93CB7